jgi:hypothetical protein
MEGYNSEFMDICFDDCRWMDMVHGLIERLALLSGV